MRLSKILALTLITTLSMTTFSQALIAYVPPTPASEPSILGSFMAIALAGFLVKLLKK